MNAFIYWNNEYTTRIGAYYNETINTFKIRVLKSYGQYDVRIMVCPYNDNEGFYIK